MLKLRRNQHLHTTVLVLAHTFQAMHLVLSLDSPDSACDIKCVYASINEHLRHFWRVIFTGRGTPTVEHELIQAQLLSMYSPGRPHLRLVCTRNQLLTLTVPTDYVLKWTNRAEDTVPRIPYNVYWVYNYQMAGTPL